MYFLPCAARQRDYVGCVSLTFSNTSVISITGLYSFIPRLVFDICNILQMALEWQLCNQVNYVYRLSEEIVRTELEGEKVDDADGCQVNATTEDTSSGEFMYHFYSTSKHTHVLCVA